MGHPSNHKKADRNHGEKDPFHLGKKTKSNSVITHERQMENIRNDWNRIDKKMKNEQLTNTIQHKASRRNEIEKDYRPFSCSSWALIQSAA